MSKIRYVVGFMFNQNKTDVLLIEKKKPKWQIGKFNGVGGKIEDSETSLQAMRRECKEETGIDSNQWEYLVTMSGRGGNDWECQVFTAKTDDVFDFKTMEHEKVCLLPIQDLDQYKLVSNLYWLIPMCLDSEYIDYSLTNKPQ